MLKILAAAISFLVMIGAGYVVTASVEKEMQSMTSLLQAELSTITEQLSITRQCVTRPNIDQAGFKESNYLNDEVLKNEVIQIIRDTVSSSLQQHLQPILTSVSRPEVSWTQSDPHYDPEVTRIGIAKATAAIDSAIAQGMWDRRNALALAKALEKLPGKDKEEIYGRFFVSINNGEIQIPEGMSPALLLTGQTLN